MRGEGVALFGVPRRKDCHGNDMKGKGEGGGEGEGGGVGSGFVWRAKTRGLPLKRHEGGEEG